MAGKRSVWRTDWRLYTLLLPGLIFVAIFTFYPIGKMLAMSFFDWRIGYRQTSEFVGLENYSQVLADPIALRALVNTLMYAVVTVPLQMALGLIVALLINGITKFSVTFRLAYYFPVITSWVVVALLFRYIFSNQGLLNYFLADVLHVVGEPVGWLSSRVPALVVAMFLGIWKGIGWNMVIFLAALQAVPKEYYEASSIDGLNGRQQFFRITLPSIRGTLLFALVMLCIGAFNTYTPIAVLTGGNPAHQTEMVLTWMYFQTFNVTGKMGYSAALSIIITLIITSITVILFRTLARKGE
ncbi:sugar ABC transporter permease [Cohnella sp. AR92]|nr:sugar ABC transporter permease [Cohnella sp. AR92]